MPLDPTTRGDVIADRLRQWYEANRETWWDRNKFLPWHAAPDRAGVHADNFMLNLVNELRRIDKDTPR